MFCVEKYAIVIFRVSAPCVVSVSDVDHWNSTNEAEFDKKKRKEALNIPAVCTYEDQHVLAVFLRIRRQKISYMLRVRSK